MNSSVYIPDKGDIVWAILDPRTGHEQSGRRPVLVLSRRIFTKHTSLAVICPITSKVKGLPFEVRIKTSNIDGAVLPIHIRSVDVAARKFKFIEQAPDEVMQKVSRAIELLVD